MMNFSLFEHQNEFVDAVRADLRTYKSTIACAPTGAGKTKMFIKISYDAQVRGTATLIITESVKIFNQIVKERRAILIMRGVKYVDILPGKVYVAMAQTLKLRPEMLKAFAALGKKLLVINDEAHIGHATKILRQLPEAYLIGFTATPDARSAPHIPELYKYVTVTEKMQPEWLVNNKRLASYRHKARKTANLADLKVVAGEYTEESQERAFSTRVVFDGLEDDLAGMQYKKCIIYCASINHAEMTADELRGHGFTCCVVHSRSDPGELGKFQGGPVNICVSVGILTKGFDYDLIDLVVIYRKTNSLPLYLQMCGRGSRMCIDKDGNLVIEPNTGLPVKDSFTVLDYGENFQQHGYWITERDWVELAKPIEKKKKKEGAPPSKMCPQCDSIIPVSTRICPYCEYEYPVAELEKPPESVLVDVTSAYESLKGKKLSQLTPAEMATYAKTTNKRNYCIRVARRMNDFQPGYLREYAINMGYVKQWHHIKEKEPSGEFTDYFIR